MILLKLSDIEKTFGERLLFSFPELVVNENDRIGLVGVNGSGKTTLLDIINGDIQPEKGQIQCFGEISYFKQFSDSIGIANQKLLKELNVSNKVNQENTSGGEKTRLRLAETFSKQNHLLLLDEPTSNLDLDGITLLKRKLQKYSSFILISHDTALLNEFCNRIIELRNNTLFFYQGDYSSYKEQMEFSFASQQREYENYIGQRKRLQDIYVQKKAKAKDMGKKPKSISSSEYKVRNYVATSRSNGGRQKSMEQQAKAVQSRINHLEVKERPKEIPKIEMNFALTLPPENKIVIRAEDLVYSYGEQNIFSKTSFLVYNHQKLAIIGPNGCGKTTLLRCVEKQNSNIKIVPKAQIGFLYQEFDNLRPDDTVIQSVLENSIQDISVSRAILAQLLFSERDLNKSISVLSGGEKIKLSLAKLFVSNANVIVLDEPTNYLDVFSVEALGNLLKSYEGTIIFVSHDKNFVNEVATDLLIIKNKQIKMFHGNLDAYEKHLKQPKENTSVQKTLLEFKLAQLVSFLAEMPIDKREQLEQEYDSVSNQLKNIKKHSQIER